MAIPAFVDALLSKGLDYDNRLDKLVELWFQITSYFTPVLRSGTESLPLFTIQPLNVQ